MSRDFCFQFTSIGNACTTCLLTRIGSAHYIRAALGKLCQYCSSSKLFIAVLLCVSLFSTYAQAYQFHSPIENGKVELFKVKQINGRWQPDVQHVVLSTSTDDNGAFSIATPFMSGARFALKVSTLSGSTTRCLNPSGCVKGTKKKPVPYNTKLRLKAGLSLWLSFPEDANTLYSINVDLLSHLQFIHAQNKAKGLTSSNLGASFNLMKLLLLQPYKLAGKTLSRREQGETIWAGLQGMVEGDNWSSLESLVLQIQAQLLKDGRYVYQDFSNTHSTEKRFYLNPFYSELNKMLNAPEPPTFSQPQAQTSAPPKPTINTPPDYSIVKGTPYAYLPSSGTIATINMQTTAPSGTSNTATKPLPWATKIKIIEQPQPVSLKEGETLHLSIQAQGAQPIRYTWRKYGSKELFGQNQSELIIPNATHKHSGLYRVTLSNQYGVVVSKPVQVSITKAYSNIGGNLPPQTTVPAPQTTVPAPQTTIPGQPATPTNQLPPVNSNPPKTSGPAVRKIVLDWSMPDSRTNNKDLYPYEIAGYQLVYGPSPYYLTHQVSLSGAEKTHYEISEPSFKNYYFKIATKDIFGRYSQYSPVLHLAIP